MMSNLCTLLCLFIVLISGSCSLGVVKRSTGLTKKEASVAKREFFIRKKLVILPIHNESPFGGKDLEVLATEEIRKYLMASKRYLLDLQSLRSYPTSQVVYQGGGRNLNSLIKKAKGSGVNLIVYGRIVDSSIRQKEDDIGLIREVFLFGSSTVEIRVIDVSTEQEVLVKKVDAFTEDKSYQIQHLSRENKFELRRDLLRQATKLAIGKLIKPIWEKTKKKEWFGRVAKIAGKKIYINAGIESGVKIGDIMKVLTPTQDIFDPVSGALIGKTKGEVKSTVEITDFFGNNGAVGIIHSGGNVSPGDQVTLY
jgi:hypothetical protein